MGIKYERRGVGVIGNALSVLWLLSVDPEPVEASVVWMAVV